MIFKNAKIITLDKVIESGYLITNEELISEVKEGSIDHGIDLSGLTIFPGFIDMHTHGLNNCDFMDGTTLSLDTITTGVLSEGTTSLLATTMTESKDKINKALKTIGDYSNEKGAKILGVHLEGPFLNKKFKGAQNEKYIIEGTKELFEEFYHNSNNLIRVVTIAVEQHSEVFLKYLVDKGILLSLGHSNATHDEVKKAMEIGASRVTHCYNAQSKLHHRDLGIVGSALLYDELNIELISDLIHVSSPALKLAYKNNKDNIILITDSIRAKNMADGEYDLGAQKVIVKDSIARTVDGALAGSTLHLNEGAKNFKEATDIDLITLSKSLSYNQAKELKLTNEIGSIEKGKIADLTIVDDNFVVWYTIVNGKIQYSKEGALWK